MTPADMYRDTKANLERRYSNPHAKRRGTIASALVLVAIVALLECVFYVLYSMSSSTVKGSPPVKRRSRKDGFFRI